MGLHSIYARVLEVAMGECCAADNTLKQDESDISIFNEWECVL